MMRNVLLAICMICGGLLSHTAYADMSFLASPEYGACSKDAKQRVLRLLRLIKEEKDGYEEEKALRAVNAFFHKQIWLVEDYVVWHKKDYWATPAETLCKGKGDSEDFAIAKYFTLKEAGFSEERLRLVYANSRFGPVVVLLYYPGDGNAPFVLDYKQVVKLNRKKKSLKPVYAFNAYRLWMLHDDWSFTETGDVHSLAAWQNVLKKIHLQVQ